MQRGACTFRLKAESAAAAGAIGAIIFNQGNADGRLDPIAGTFGSGYGAGLPVLFASYFLGEDCASTRGLELRVLADVVCGEATTYNVIAGAHLESLAEGPGIQDNGTGSAAILETAIQMARTTPQNTVRCAWWAPRTRVSSDQPSMSATYPTTKPRRSRLT